MKNRIPTFSKLNKVALKIAAGSFVVGTLLFLTTLLMRVDALYVVGYLFIMISFFVNFVLVFSVFFHLLVTKTCKEHLFTLYCILINIPIAIGYFVILI